jgi:hypothetical protein
MPKDMSQTLFEAAGAEVVNSKMLVTLFLDSGTKYYVANSTREYVIDDHLYEAMQIKRGPITTSVDGKVEKIEVSFSNITRKWAIMMALNGNKFNNRVCLIEEYFPDCPDEKPVLIFEGIMNAPKMSLIEFQIDVIKTVGDYDSQSPNITFGPNCQYRFKDGRCRYTGSETKCDRTMARCIALGNVLNIGGHPSVPNEMIIKNSRFGA